MGKKLESSFKNMVLVLFLVTLVSSAAVEVVNSLTSGLIEKVKIENRYKPFVPWFPLLIMTR